MYGRRQASSRAWRAPAPVTSSPAPPLGDVIERITQDSLKSDGDHVGIENVKLVASYNWISSSSPEIIIPGQPPRWTPPKGPSKLPGDSGEYYRDVNAAAFPKHPLEPAIVSVMKMNPSPIPVNIVACGSTIGNLLRFARGVGLDRPFRMLVEKVGETVHLIRRENSPREKIEGVRGYGHTFPEMYTTWDSSVKRSTSHQRILSYQFGGLDLMVRFEGDGYISSSPVANIVKGHAFDDLESLGIVESLSNGTGKLKLSDGGESVPQSSIFDLKTRSVIARGEDHLGEQLPRLWIAQVTQFLLAYHERGFFRDSNIEIKNVEADITEWQDLNQPSLKRLAALLRLIIDKAHASKDGRLEIVWSNGGSLEIRQQLSGAGDVLSNPARKQWEAWLGNENKNPEDSEREEELTAAQSDSDSDSGSDYAACDQECGYCGKCIY
ncbi:hypothetical protein NOF04DRAFT_1042239 [Fusarium oxysporum II5]|uniref:Geranylgeranyl pyrophosphate synthetase n=3 Tax=Fusarium oxysporum species complex TaxID=171631 RepID=N1S6Z4_FUSC4|nr:uncharacterized protein FOIG_06362 [Fusarium odoratissimum NRRL 54006]EMT74598.1 hypothetical protein FOC4_g10000722 [Fusarium odoratissimum]EXM02049.1 hypothetical protein FOIG_06362 [Fusarium odoratissimum NRRL 54006]KAK2133873.1 hypothetical protein NOF04DRAFT_1042239 [Fusarium oxysporum II5]TXC07980.1 hypothetical protein FocTR4_00004113 [Fusarium oxysporum f. sp. cubense]